MSGEHQGPDEGERFISGGVIDAQEIARWAQQDQGTEQVGKQTPPEDRAVLITSQEMGWRGTPGRHRAPEAEPHLITPEGLDEMDPVAEPSPERAYVPKHSAEMQAQKVADARAAVEAVSDTGMEVNVGAGANTASGSEQGTPDGPSQRMTPIVSAEGGPTAAEIAAVKATPWGSRESPDDRRGGNAGTRYAAAGRAEAGSSGYTGDGTGDWNRSTSGQSAETPASVAEAERVNAAAMAAVRRAEVRRAHEAKMQNAGRLGRLAERVRWSLFVSKEMKRPVPDRLK